MCTAISASRRLEGAGRDELRQRGGLGSVHHRPGAERHELFRGRPGSIFSSARLRPTESAGHLPILEITLLDNPFWQYSRNKVGLRSDAESACRSERFPATIVRPSQRTIEPCCPFDGGYTVVARMRQGKKVIVHGDGTSLWTLTHHRDFAVGFVGLLGQPPADGESFQITSDEWLSLEPDLRDHVARRRDRSQMAHIPSEL